MLITESQWTLAFDLLSLSKKLSGQRFTEEDVERLAHGIARHAWVDEQLNEMFRAETNTQNYN